MQPLLNMEQAKLIAIALECGFTHACELNVAALEFLPDVREMCSADLCRSYNRNWSCPPACGTLEEIAKTASSYNCGILVQSTATLEDDFDIETMQETEALQKKRFLKFTKKVRELYPNCLPMASGACTFCLECTYPDAPCRFPDKMMPSMEAYGLFVSKVCEQSGMKYYYGPKTITFTSCILID